VNVFLWAAVIVAVLGVVAGSYVYFSWQPSRAVGREDILTGAFLVFALVEIVALLLALIGGAMKLF
jgi:hypothetical protein